MKQKQLSYLVISLLSATVLLCEPALVRAEGGAGLAPLLITEVQAGSTSSASEEFVELHNTTAVSIDLGVHAWRLEVAASTATDWSAPLRSIPLSGIIAPGQSYVVASQYTAGGVPAQYLPTLAAEWFSAGLSAGGGHVRLLYDTYQMQHGACGASPTTVDEVEWSASKNGAPATPSLDGRSVFLTAKTSGLAAGSSLQRLTDSVLHASLDTNNDAADFVAGIAPSPGLSNTAIGTNTGSAQAPVPLPVDGCDPNASAPGPGTGGGGSTPDPAAGDTSATDPAPGGSDGSETEQPDSVTPDPNQGLALPTVSELLPNPAAPQTDAADEFIELYNPNSTTFDLSGYVLSAGTTTAHSHIFKAGTTLAAGAYVAFFPADTGLSLSNSGGQVRLLDPQGVVIAQSDPYGTARDGVAWALAGGLWQWTTLPTPNAANAAGLPTVAKTVKTATVGKTASARKPAAVKSATTKVKTAAATKSKKATAKQTIATTVVSADKPERRIPLHPGILATVAVLAVLYGAYEYRHDVANYIRRFRDYRTARRKGRSQSARRRSD